MAEKTLLGRLKSANSGQSAHFPRLFADQGKQTVPNPNRAALDVPSLTLGQCNEDWSRFDRSGVTTAMVPSEAQGPLQSNGMCLDELTVHSKLKPKASTEHTVDLPQVTS